MRSGLLDECFNEEEREFLRELLEPGVAESREALAQHEIDAGHCETAEDLVQVENSKMRQKRKIHFYELLYECLEEGGE